MVLSFIDIFVKSLQSLVMTSMTTMSIMLHMRVMTNYMAAVMNFLVFFFTVSVHNLHDHYVHNAPHESHDQLHGCCDELPCVLLHSECAQPPHTPQCRWCQQSSCTPCASVTWGSCGTVCPSCHGTLDHGNILESIHDEQLQHQLHACDIHHDHKIHDAPHESHDQQHGSYAQPEYVPPHNEWP